MRTLGSHSNRPRNHQIEVPNEGKGTSNCQLGRIKLLLSSTFSGLRVKVLEKKLLWRLQKKYGNWTWRKIYSAKGAVQQTIRTNDEITCS